MDAFGALVSFGSAGFGAVVGVLVQVFFARRKAKGEGPGGNVFIGCEDVRIGNTTVRVKTDNRVYVNAGAGRKSAAGEDGEVADVKSALRRLEREQKRITADRRSASAGGRAGSESDAFPLIICAIFVTLLVVVAYLRYLDAVHLVAAALTAFLIAFVASTMVVVVARRVGLGGWVRFQLVTTFALGVVCWYAIGMLTDPPFVSDDREFQELLDVGRGATPRTLLDQFDPDVLFFVAYQLLGLLALLLALGLMLLHSLKVYAITGLAARVAADHGYRPGRLRSWLIYRSGSPTWCWGSSLVVTAFALLLVSGGYATLMERFSTTPLS